MKHILAEHEARDVATSQEHDDDQEFDSPASEESAMLVCPATRFFSFFAGISQW